MSELAVDLFKFVALRSPADADAARSAARFLRDPRVELVAHYPLPDAEKDAAEFEQSPAAKAVHDRAKAALAGLPSPADPDAPEADIPKVNRAIATTFALESLDPAAANAARIAALVARIASAEFSDLDAVVEAAEEALVDADGTTLQNYVAATGNDDPPIVADRGAAFDALYRSYVAKQVRPLNLEAWFAAVRVVSALAGILVGRGALTAEVAGVPAVTTLERFDTIRRATPVLHPIFGLLVGYYRPFSTIEPVGIGDLLVVKQFLRSYEPGEVAHVENVLQGEHKSRTHRMLDRTEDLLTSERETIQETVRELQSTERFELKSETESTIESDLNAEMSGQVSGRYGVVEVSASAGVSYSRSSEDSRRSSNNFAKDVIDRSLTRIQTKVREERTRRLTHEVEETNVHELDNRGDGNGNIAGIYRWIDKHYTAQVYNYGKRLMFEFVLPEPAAFVLAAFDRSKNLDALPPRPQEPAKPNLVLSAITQDTLDTYADIYPLGQVRARPDDEMLVSEAITGGVPSGEAATAHEKKFAVPEGYAATKAEIAGAFSGFNALFQNKDYGVFVSIGGQTRSHETPWDQNKINHEFPKKDINFNPPLTGSPTASVVAFRVEAFEVSVALTIKLTPEALRKWQTEVYVAIMDAWAKEFTQYQSDLAEYEDRLDALKVGRGVVIRGRNPRINQEIIRTELKKGCLAMVARQFDSDEADDITFDSMATREADIEETTVVRTETKTETTTTPSPGVTVKVTTTKLSDDVSTDTTTIKIPAIDVDDATGEGQIIQFLEQAFEWQQMTYVLYPYFWGRLPVKWFDAQRYYDEEDPLFARFLQAGSVRVLVAARPGFELAVMHYLRTRAPWNGGPTPGIDSDLYLAVHEELRDQQDDLNGAVVYGDAWEVVVPTSLVWLQPDANLPVFATVPEPGNSASQLWTNSAHQATLSTLATHQTEWTHWPSAAVWQVHVPPWATEVDVHVTLNPGVVNGDVWGELRLDIGGTATDAAMFDVNYEADFGGFPEQTVMIIGDTCAVPAELRGATVTVTVQGRMLDPPQHPGWLEANRGCHINVQFNFKAGAS